MRPNPRQTSSTGAHLRTGRWLSRALIAVVAVLGLLAMHGLTMNHRTGMASMSTMGASATASAAATAEETPTQQATANAKSVQAIAMHTYEQMSGNRVASLTENTSQVLAALTSDGMASACVAFLTVLLIVFSAGRPLALRRRSAFSTGTSRGESWFATAVDRLRPDLGELSVLRT